MEIATPAYHLFDRNSDAERERGLAREPGDVTRRERRVYCARCRLPITTHQERISVNGAHEHNFTNPHGLHFHIGCFRDAPGCGTTGVATMEYTWFPGYAWRIAHCAQCETHLGWLFGSPTDSFYGLILDRLISAVR